MENSSSNHTYKIIDTKFHTHCHLFKTVFFILIMLSDTVYTVMTREKYFMRIIQNRIFQNFYICRSTTIKIECMCEVTHFMYSKVSDHIFICLFHLVLLKLDSFLKWFTKCHLETEIDWKIWVSMRNSFLNSLLNRWLLYWLGPCIFDYPIHDKKWNQMNIREIYLTLLLNWHKMVTLTTTTTI